MHQQLNNNNKVIYLSFDGLTDPLGQSQILPYIKGLSKHGYRFYVISFEKSKYYKKIGNEVRKQCQYHNITWIQLKYTNKPSVLSTLLNILILYYVTLKLHKKHQFNFIHCRCYVTSLVGLAIKKRKNIKFLFDMRSFWADQRVEGNIWNKNNLVYKKIYSFFKKKEKQFLLLSDKIVILTHAAKNYVVQNYNIQENKIEVIPCATSFSNKNYGCTEDNTEQIKLAYLGSVRSVYLPDEMFLFFSIFLKKYPNAKFHILTYEDKDYFLPYLLKYKIDKSKLLVKFVYHNDVFSELSTCNLGLCFIKQSFSSIGVSNTKFAEMLAANLPVVCNNIGDLKEHCKQIQYTYCFDQLNEVTFTKFIDNFNFPNIEERKKISIEARKIYDLDLAINKYLKVYKSLHD